jgi:hypothetical protein
MGRPGRVACALLAAGGFLNEHNHLTDGQDERAIEWGRAPAHAVHPAGV